MALALPVLSTERLAGVIPTRSANSPDDILRRAIITSTFTMIAMIGTVYMVRSFSSFIFWPTAKSWLTMSKPNPMTSSILSISLWRLTS